jgi:hypothetical protein
LLYYSPQKFRHGNAVYSIKLAKDIAALKAVSQTLMHSNLSITDGIYGILSEIDIRKQIDRLVPSNPNSENINNKLLIALRDILQNFEAKQ